MVLSIMLCTNAVALDTNGVWYSMRNQFTHENLRGGLEYSCVVIPINGRNVRLKLQIMAAKKTQIMEANSALMV